MSLPESHELKVQFMSDGKNPVKVGSRTGHRHGDNLSDMVTHKEGELQAEEVTMCCFMLRSIFSCGNECCMCELFRATDECVCLNVSLMNCFCMCELI